jgi:hypothetical protein
MPVRNQTISVSAERLSRKCREPPLRESGSRDLGFSRKRIGPGWLIVCLDYERYNANQTGFLNESGSVIGVVSSP